MAKLLVASLSRSRADASIQKRLGLKVGGTMTTFSVSSDGRRYEIDAWGATPGERSSAAKKAFIQDADYWGEKIDGKATAAVIRRRA